jgi:hypothetical protein
VRPFTVSSAVKETLDAEMADACTVDGKIRSC